MALERRQTGKVRWAYAGRSNGGTMILETEDGQVPANDVMMSYVERSWSWTPAFQTLHPVTFCEGIGKEQDLFAKSLGIDRADNPPTT